MKRPLYLLAPTAIAVIFGPLIAGLGLCLVELGSSIFNGFGSSTMRDLFGYFIFVIIFAYFVGSPIALLAGIFVSLWMIRRPPNAMVVNAAAAIATAVFMGVAATGVLGPVEQTNGRSNFWFVLVAAIFVANVCWLLTRRFAPAAAKQQA